MSSPLHDPDRPDQGGYQDDVSIVPGLGPSGPLDPARDPDRYDASAAYDPVVDSPYPADGRLDPSQDPDRFDAAADITAVGGPLDRSLDPDRYAPPGQGQTLTDLLGEGAHEESRDNMSWAYGLLSIVAFLAFVSWFFANVATP